MYLTHHAHFFILQQNRPLRLRRLNLSLFLQWQKELKAPKNHTQSICSFFRICLRVPGRADNFGVLFCTDVHLYVCILFVISLVEVVYVYYYSFSFSYFISRNRSRRVRQPTYFIPTDPPTVQCRRIHLCRPFISLAGVLFLLIINLFNPRTFQSLLPTIAVFLKGAIGVPGECTVVLSV